MGEQVEVPHPDPGTFDTETEAQIPLGVIGLWSDDVGHVSAFTIRPSAITVLQRHMEQTFCPKTGQSSSLFGKD
jgi:hypothetical protein